MDLSDVGAPLDVAALTGRVDELRGRYAAARPWPHLVLHDLFPPDLLREAKRECLGVSGERMFRSTDWRHVKEESPAPAGPATETVLRALERDDVVAFLSALTGIPDLVADPTRLAAGVHRTPPGGFTLVHRDFRRHAHTRLHHRVNVLLYLNEGWREEFGGHLELWPGDMAGPPARIAPQANTLVVWETHDQTPHGLPEPVACPPDDARVALASYYYTRAPRAERVKRRGPTYVRRPGDPWLVGHRTPTDVARSLAWRAQRVRDLVLRRSGSS